MRLIRTRLTNQKAPGRTTLQLHEFHAPPADQPYAILSHTWGKLKDELLFTDVFRICDQNVLLDDGFISADLSEGRGLQLTKKPGWIKIENSLKEAAKNGLHWLWADTICIDKSSSAELSEAINSMWAWYSKSAICFVFLEDVSYKRGRYLLEEGRLDSRWATRGWTLQELLAPVNVDFFSSDWVHLGDKRKLSKALHRTTLIDVEILEGRRSTQSASVAKRMSWAADRETTRPEDRAYSLMGLFDVNMPMLYGEGDKAFLRLQEEILRRINDHSILAWRKEEEPIPEIHGLLADSPSDFRHSSRYQPYSYISEQLTLTSRGLNVNLYLSQVSDRSRRGDQWLARLQCPIPDTSTGYLVVRLSRLATGDRDFGRVNCGQILSAFEQNDVAELRTIFVPQTFPDHARDAIMPRHKLRIMSVTTLPPWYDPGRSLLSNAEKYKLSRVWAPIFETGLLSRSTVDPDIPLSLGLSKTTSKLAYVLVFRATKTNRQRLIVMVGTDTRGDLGFTCRELPTDLCIPENGDYPREIALLTKSFHPLPAGRSMDVGQHSVNVEVSFQLTPGTKEYLLDFTLRNSTAPPPDYQPPKPLLEGVTPPKDGGSESPGDSTWLSKIARGRKRKD